MGKQAEYEALREEIIFAMQTVKNYRSLLYSAVGVLLAFAFDKNEPVLFLVPFVVIIPLYVLSMHQIDSTMRIGAYICVFLEDKNGCQWETRLLEYDKLHQNKHEAKKPRIDVFWCVSFVCLAFSFMKLDCSDKDFYFIIVLQAIILLVCIYLFIRKRPDYLGIKMHYLEEWKKIKEKENRESE